MTSLIFPANKSFLGVAKETTYGTPVGAPTFWIPFKDPSWKPNQAQLMDDAMYGDMVTNHGMVAGTRHDVFTYKTFLFLDTLFQHMQALLGSTDTVTGAGDPYTHVCSIKNSGTAQPPSYTIWLYNGAETWQMAGCVETKVDVDLKVTALGEMSVEWLALPGSVVSTPTNTPSTAKPWASWNTTITANGVTATNFSSVKLNYQRTVEAVQTNDGTQAPYLIFGGPLTGAIDLDGVYQGVAGTPTDLANLLANTQIPIIVKVNPVGDSTHYGQWQHTLCGVDSNGAEVKSAAGKYVEITAKYDAIGNTTDATDGGTSFVKFTMLTTASAAF